jgi:hypothetical protein
MRLRDLYIFLIPIFAVGCDTGKPSDKYTSQEEIVSYIERLQAVEDELSTLKIDLKDLQKYYWESEQDIWDIKFATMPNNVHFNLKEKGGFSRVNSSIGIFFVSVEEVHPYLDCYKVIFIIGNPYAISFVDPTIKLKWNRTYEKYLYECKEKGVTPKYSEYIALSKEKEFSIIKDLKPKTWNQVELVLNATVDELENVRFSFTSTGTISMSVESN